MASAETEIYFEEDYFTVNADYEHFLKSLKKEEAHLSLLMKAKEGDGQALDFLIEESRERVREIKKKIETLEDIKELETPFTDSELQALEEMKRGNKLTSYGETVVASVCSPKLNGERDVLPADVLVSNGGCPIPSREQTDTGEQNTNHVQALGDEATSRLVSSTGAPPGCDGPRPKCLDVDSVMPPGPVSTDSRHHSPSDGTESTNQAVVSELQSASVSEGNEKDVDMNDNKVTETKEMEKNQTKKNKKKKKEKKVKAEKPKSKNARRGFISRFFCCFLSQEKRNVTKEEGVMKESVIEETTL